MATSKKTSRKPRARTAWKQARIPDTAEVQALLKAYERHLLKRSGLAAGSLPFHVVVITALKEAVERIGRD
jgi:hypothetical protein